MNALKLAKFKKRGLDILQDLKDHPEKQELLEKILRDNGFGKLADLALDLKNEFIK